MVPAIARRKSKTSGELDVDTTLDSEGMETPRSHTSSASRANTLGRQVKSFSDGKAATPSSNISRASSFTAGESPPASTKSIETTPYKSEDREQKKSRGLFGMGARKDKGKGEL